MALLDSTFLYFTLPSLYFKIRKKNASGPPISSDASALLNKCSVPMVLCPSICVMAMLLAMSLCTIIVALGMYIVPTLGILSKLLQGELQQKDYQIKVQDIEIREKVAQINRQQRELQALTVSLRIFYCKNRNDQPIIWLLG